MPAGEISRQSQDGFADPRSGRRGVARPGEPDLTGGVAGLQTPHFKLTGIKAAEDPTTGPSVEG